MIRRGHSLVEAIAAMATGCVLMTLLAGALVVHVRAAASVARTAETGEALTLSAAVLSAELRATGADDPVAIGEDSLALRAFRATAIVCDTLDRHALLRWSGSRAPDAAKDSALVLRGGDAWTIALAAPTTMPAGSCGAPSVEQVFRIDAAGALRPGDVLLAFERGAYHLSTRALRWRPAGAGRQPLTAEVFDDASSGFTGPPAHVHMTTRPVHPRDVAVTWTLRLRSTDGEAWR